MEKLKVAVIVEVHPYDVIAFKRMLDSFTMCECFVQPLDLFVRDEDNMDAYDVLLFYNMNKDMPEAGSPLERFFKERLGKKSQGVIFLHHAVLSHQGWGVFTDITGISSRGDNEDYYYLHDQPVRQTPVTTHPITEGMESFILTDETYFMAEPDRDGNTALLTTDNPDSIKTLAWARIYRNCRVFCYASGHDNQAYADPSFRRVLGNAIRWVSGMV